MSSAANRCYGRSDDQYSTRTQPLVHPSVLLFTKVSYADVLPTRANPPGRVGRVGVGGHWVRVSASWAVKTVGEGSLTVGARPACLPPPRSSYLLLTTAGW